MVEKSPVIYSWLGIIQLLTILFYFEEGAGSIISILKFHQAIFFLRESGF